MLLPDGLRPVYHDPELWTRLGPRVVEHFDEQAQVVLQRRVETMDTYAFQMGYLAALRWVLAEAHDLTRTERD